MVSFYILSKRFYLKLKRLSDAREASFTEKEYCSAFFVNIKYLKDTHRYKALSNKTPAFTRTTNIGILVVGISNQLVIRGS